MKRTKTRVKSHKLSSIIAIVSILMVFMLSGVLAYLKDSEEVTNVFTIGEVNIELIEKVSGTAGGGDEVLWNTVLTSVTGRDGTGSSVTVDALANIYPGQVINKQPYVKNTGKNNAYVYLKVAVPKVSVNGTPTELFSYTTNSGWTQKGTTTETVDNITYNVYKYQYDNTLAPNGITGTLFDSVTVVNTDWTPTDLANMAEVQKIDINAYAIQTEGVTLAQGYNIFFPIEAVGEITVANYGQYVDIGTNILSKTIALEDGTTPKADWRVFSKDSSGAWLILADYMPNSAFDVTTTGLEVGAYYYATYGVMSRTSRVALLNGLDHSNWSNLITGSSVAGKNGVVAKGAVDLPTWRDSWNANTGYTTLYTPKTTSAMSDGLYGYYVGNSSTTTNTYYNSLNSNAGYSDTLYFPHKSCVSNCNGYWLASPSATGTDYVMYVDILGRVNYNNYDDDRLLGVRPAVYLPSDIRLNTEGEVWTIAN